MCRSKYELEGAARVEELEEARKKLIIKLQETEEHLESQTAKASNMEKIKNRMQADLEDVTIELERVSQQVTTNRPRVRIAKVSNLLV